MGIIIFLGDVKINCHDWCISSARSIESLITCTRPALLETGMIGFQNKTVSILVWISNIISSLELLWWLNKARVLQKFQKKICIALMCSRQTHSRGYGGFKPLPTPWTQVQKTFFPKIRLLLLSWFSTGKLSLKPSRGHGVSLWAPHSWGLWGQLVTWGHSISVVPKPSPGQSPGIYAWQ